MSFRGVERIFGMPSSSDPTTLLGLPPGRADRVQIEAALEARLREIFEHPEGRGPFGEEARLVMRAAAARLIQVNRRTGPDARPLVQRVARGAERFNRPPQLTEFDRYVLATLVAGGGWNAQSRARLVALASSYGVSASGLFRVMRGLADYASVGHHRFDLREITSGASRVAPMPARASEGMPGGEGRLGERMGMAPEELSGGVWPTVKLSLLFGAITTLIFALFLRIIWPEADATIADGGTPAIAAPPAEAPTVAVAGAPDRPRVARDRLAVFRPAPSFLGNALPSEATDSADRCPQLPSEVDLLTRKLSITDEPSDAVLRSWDDAVRAIASGWVLTDESTRQAVTIAMGESLFEAADSARVSDRLLEAMRTPRAPYEDPIDVWRGAWQAGTLATLGASRVLPPTVVERARVLLAEAVEHEAGDRPLSFRDGADAWLARAAVHLTARLELDSRTYDFWEAWIAAQRELGTGERFEGRLIDAVAAVAATETDLSRPGPSANVVGRLLTIADFEASAAVRDRFEAILDDDETYSAHDVWVLTSLLAQLDTAPWFDEQLVLPHDAGRPFRNRIRDRILDRWPEIRSALATASSRGRGVMVDPRAGGRWMSLLGRLTSEPMPSGDVELAGRLLIASRLNEAALLLADRDVAGADEMMDGIEELAAPA